jgi:hypothetical protein
LPPEISSRPPLASVGVVIFCLPDGFDGGAQKISASRRALGVGEAGSRVAKVREGDEFAGYRINDAGPALSLERRACHA